MKTVQILLSSYNGEKYISRQIDSILCQKDVEIHLLIRWFDRQYTKNY